MMDSHRFSVMDPQLPGSDLIDGDHEEGTLSSSSKGKETICNVTEVTLQLCSSKRKEPICDNMERTQCTYFICKDRCFDPLCVWGNEILVNQHQVRKLIKTVSKIGQKITIKLFVYTLSSTTVNCRMVMVPKAV
ncbi:hypothetical protein D1007_37344 [Hordeum vulgare]|nr:hypothetical protein D1007_37344 [Hordeum vulgare]